MGTPAIAATVADLVDSLTDQVIRTLGAPPEPMAFDGARHVLMHQLGKVVADYLLRAATK